LSDDYSEVSSLPLLLAGPILRRVDSEQVCVWTAWSEPCVVKLEIFRAVDIINQSMHSGIGDHHMSIGSGDAKPFQLGQHLYISLAIARPHHNSTITAQSRPEGRGNFFPSGELLAYDLECTIHDRKGDKRLALKDLGLLSGRNSIVYSSHSEHGDTNSNLIDLPTFFLPVGGLAPRLNVLYGSCRKLHGKGNDSLASADQIVRNNLTDLKKRPSALFLIGDQIYADDVAGPLIHYLTSFGNTLLGFEEQIDGIDSRLIDIPVGQRQQLVQKYAGFTSGSAGNHLISFGEFVAMYLIAWNADNWPKKFLDPPHLAHKEQEKGYRTEIEQLENARKVLPNVRRLLANIPTYMIFDDHEITDDWNITKEWQDNVDRSRCGKQIIANGLAAYWAFQAWGNDPDAFYGDFVSRLAQCLQKIVMPVTSQKELTDLQEALLKFHGWAFSCPTSPVTVFLDCRTQRHFNSFNGPAQLLNGEAIQSLFDIAQKAGYKNGDPIVIVVPTPVFGFDLVEKMQVFLAMMSSIYEVDLETWSANKSGFGHFLTFILEKMNPSDCIFISGDVHYGFTISARFSLVANRTGLVQPTLNITQLNSSALKTTSLGKEVAIGATLGHIRQLFFKEPSIFRGWNNVDDYDFVQFSHVSNPKRRHHYEIVRVMLKVLRHRLSQTRRQLPDWIATIYIKNLSGSILPSTIIADNNIGHAVIDFKQATIFHTLLVGNGEKIKIHEAIVSLAAKIKQNGKIQQDWFAG